LSSCSVLVALLARPGVSWAQAPSAFATQKAETLLREHLPCLGCHTLRGEGGSIGPDLTTVRDRRSPAYIAAMIRDPQRVVPGSVMPQTRMPESTRQLITSYLSALPGNGVAEPSPSSPGASNTPGAPDGAALYAKWCAACHGATGKGDGPNAARLPVKPAEHASREAMSARPDDSLYDTIAAGGLVMNRSPRMPAFGATLTAAEIRALVRHIRTLCRCQGPGWSRNP
ncbi:MAG TPA: c-type cytochrome, partial [Gemmatimonadaceae bacterium]